MSTSHALLAMPCNAAWDSNDTFRSLNGDTLYNIILYILYIFTIYIYYITICIFCVGDTPRVASDFLVVPSPADPGSSVGSRALRLGGDPSESLEDCLSIYTHNILSIFIYCRLI